MVMMSVVMFLSIFIPMVVLMVAWILSKRSLSDREKTSPFECGFDPGTTARVPFSMRFFLLAILFIVFDIEIVLLMSIPAILMNTFTEFTLFAYLMFLLILTIGLIHEWNEGSLDWTH